MIYGKNLNDPGGANEHHAIILNIIAEGVLELNPAGEIVYANPAAVSITGVSKDKLLGSNLSEIASDGDRDKIQQWRNEKEGVSLKNSALCITTATNDKCISLNGLSIDKAGRKSELVILNDLSEQLRMKAQIQRAERMEAIGTLAGGVAHDLNNILSGLVSYPELLLLQLPKDNPLRKPIQTIQNAGERAAEVVQDLLTLSRRGVLVSSPLNLNDLITAYLKSPEHEKFKQQFPWVEIKTFLENDMLKISGSATHLSKAIINLISNAGEAMPEGRGTITVSTENQYLDRPLKGYTDIREGDYVVLTVADNGSRISLHDMEKIFEPFYTKKKMGMNGTGLGMSVVWGTVQDHNGYIDVKSAEGKGTVFRLFFPLVRETLPEIGSFKSQGSYYGNGETILIVDDVEDQRILASMMLTQLGYSTQVMASGEDAVEYLQTHSVDLVVLDMIMYPGMDGLDTYQKILERHPEQRAIIVSGYSETNRVKALQRLGAGAYVKKPFLLETLGVAVKEELEKSR